MGRKGVERVRVKIRMKDDNDDSMEVVLLDAASCRTTSLKAIGRQQGGALESGV
jgi:hypothetical protein